jgi:NDP-sugar pyrophosphorylase family protein
MKTAILLAGGKGTRLGTSNEVAKAMLIVKGKTLLQWQLDRLKNKGFDAVILCLGHGKEKVKYDVPEGLEVYKVVEEEPLGTAGAVKFAYDQYPMLCRDGVLVINVDDLVKDKDYDWLMSGDLPIVFGRPIPYSVWVNNVMFSQNEAVQHIGHTFLPMIYLDYLPSKGSLEVQLAEYSKCDQVKSIVFDGFWLTVNDWQQLKEANEKWS